MVGKTIVINGIEYVQKNTLNAKVSKAKAVKSNVVDMKASCIEWITKHLEGNPTVTETNLKVKLPTKAGIKEYDAVKFSNGETRVFVKGDSKLVKVWN